MLQDGGDSTLIFSLEIFTWTIHWSAHLDEVLPSRSISVGLSLFVRPWDSLWRRLKRLFMRNNHGSRSIRNEEGQKTKILYKKNIAMSRYGLWSHIYLPIWSDAFQSSGIEWIFHNIPASRSPSQNDGGEAVTGRMDSASPINWRNIWNRYREISLSCRQDHLHLWWWQDILLKT